MKMDLRDARKRRIARRIAERQWRRWFAWKPVEIERNVYVWGDVLERRRVFDAFGYSWEYRELPASD